MRVRIRWLAHGLYIEYSGYPEQLLKAGAATPEMLQPGRRGMSRFDADGDRFSLSRQYTIGRVVLARWKSPARASDLPGVKEWLATQSGAFTDG